MDVKKICLTISLFLLSEHRRIMKRNTADTKYIHNIIFVLLLVSLIGTHLWYPKWAKEKTEATISWDVSGYYMYLPAIFIYRDLKQCSFREDILDKYQPSTTWVQGYDDPISGNHIMKYSSGQALLYLPFFLVAHTWASASSYIADGFSFPYQICLSFGMLLYAFLGLLYLRKVLTVYFSPTPTILSLVAIVLGSNYLNYSAIDGAMTHNTLFTIYVLILYLTIQFYRKASFSKAIGIGALVGLAALIRPTDIVSALIPIFWGINGFKRREILERGSFFKQHWRKVLLAVVICLSVGSIQLIYWKYVSGRFFVYSYEDQGFSWLNPHIVEGLFSYKSGWFPYSPMMITALIGLVFLWKKARSIAFIITSFTLIYLYITFAWDEWTYGGSIGQRAMIQAYPILAFSIASFFTSFLNWKKWIQIPIGILLICFIYLNFWFTKQAHKEGMLHVGEMTKAYYWKTLGKRHFEEQWLTLLDDENIIYSGERLNVETIYQNKDWKVHLDQNNQKESISIPIQKEMTSDFLRVSIQVGIALKEWETWAMTQFVCILKNEEVVQKSNMMRIHRMLQDNEEKRIYLDISMKGVKSDELEIIMLSYNKKQLDACCIELESFDGM